MKKYDVKEVMKVFEYIKKNCKDVSISINLNQNNENHGISFSFENKEFNRTEIRLFPEELASPAKITETKTL